MSMRYDRIDGNAELCEDDMSVFGEVLYYTMGGKGSRGSAVGADYCS